MASFPEFTPANPLPRGRHKLRRREVLDSQRERLVSSVLECVAERGYAATTIADLVAKARVSRNAFYDAFEDKADCYIAACDEEATRMLEELYSYASEPTWIDSLREGMRAFLRWWQDRPGYSVAYLVELPTAGRRALDQRDRVYARFEALFEGLAARARVEQPKLPPLPALAPRLVVTSITEIIGQEVRAGRLESLHELEDELTFFIIKTLADDRTAVRALRRPKAA